MALFFTAVLQCTGNIVIFLKFQEFFSWTSLALFVIYFDIFSGSELIFLNRKLISDLLKIKIFLYSIPLCWFIDWYIFFKCNYLRYFDWCTRKGTLSKKIFQTEKKPVTVVLFSKTHKMPSMHSCALFFLI